jgi:hypothetical protein
MFMGRKNQKKPDEMLGFSTHAKIVRSCILIRSNVQHFCRAKRGLKNMKIILKNGFPKPRSLGVSF